MNPEQMETLRHALRARFEADVRVEKVAHRDRYRFEVISPRFSDMPHLSRQDRVWEVIDEVVPRDALMGISIILTYAPDELELHTL